MEELEKYKAELIGQKLTRVFHTDQGEGVEHVNGLGLAYYFSTVFELENGTKYQFSNDWIGEWDESVPLFEVTHKSWSIEQEKTFNSVHISDIFIDEYEEVYIRLENDLLIYATVDNGVQLFVDHYSDLFMANGDRLEAHIITTNPNKKDT